MTIDLQQMIETTVSEDAGAVPDLGTVQHRANRRRRRRAVGRGLGGIAVVALVVAGATVVASWDREGGPVVTDTVGSPTTTPSSTVTTVPVDGTTWGTAATAWTGTEYLVWGGQASRDGSGRADGWRYDPATGKTRTIPVAPIAPRDSAAGAWTGTELIVCCGIPIGEGPSYDTASAAAYDPATDRWRVLAPPPPETAPYTLGAAWTGSELLVVSTVRALPGYASTDLLLHAYDPGTDTWSRRADAHGGDRVGHPLWTGEELIVWTTGDTSTSGHDRGQRYDPRSDTWTALPNLPEDHHPWYASAAWVDGQLVVWGIDQRDDLATVGYRWRPGEDAWRSMADAPVEIESWSEGTPGSQTFAVDPDTGRLLVVSVHPGSEGDGTSDVRPLLSYDPVADRWEYLGEVPALGWHRSALVVNGQVLQPDRADPVAFDVPA